MNIITSASVPEDPSDHRTWGPPKIRAEKQVVLRLERRKKAGQESVDPCTVLCADDIALGIGDHSSWILANA